MPTPSGAYWDDSIAPIRNGEPTAATATHTSPTIPAPTSRIVGCDRAGGGSGERTEAVIAPTASATAMKMPAYTGT